MELIDLTMIWVIILGFAVLMYVLMDGFDLGVGILFPFAPSDQARDDMMNSVGPVWDGNETWLVLGGAGLLAAFPMVYAVFLPALYIGVFLMLAGLIFRGVAFEFRFKARTSRYLWDHAFNIGSTVAAFAQGAVVGAYIQGFEVQGFQYAGGALDWLTPFTVMTGLGVVTGYALLGATWTLLKTEGETQAWAWRLTPWLVAGMLVFFVVVSVWTPLAHERVFQRWMSNAHVLWLFPAATLGVCGWLWHALRKRQEGTPFVATMVLFLLFYIGLLISMWPYAVPPHYTFWDAASAPGSQLFLLLGFLFVIPFVLGYTAWTYWVFRGKVRRDGGYGH
ncbi:cytochrome d ubiquinol oxidase subunit II [Alkalilimnicola sp. S0819]|uniref:cytochrome d ubiquinol oxidase subunit II n=1 Tax=Alkalilimnicola sp. S0819 TaxID=2613922 RepID=UPI0012626555|nr:cytochrome d ubiquinol oxidase subunit II [Alkalilimnicola sp. S0819]KAB7624139.1 cytochrome d ubiquinol oxidase subunit II [Alkalilimnicola sp. S0819]MPQ16392.1 cytochrome d ubiquinol oxidase subunit II [Alkalilimnicola sp. S0819]